MENQPHLGRRATNYAYGWRSSASAEARMALAPAPKLTTVNRVRHTAELSGAASEATLTNPRDNEVERGVAHEPAASNAPAPIGVLELDDQPLQPKPA